MFEIASLFSRLMKTKITKRMSRNYTFVVVVVVVVVVVAVVV